jgi:hypothetical protein
VRTNQFSQSDNEEELPWQFGASILLSRRDRDQFNLTPEAKPAEDGQDSPQKPSSQETTTTTQPPETPPPATDSSNGGGKP